MKKNLLHLMAIMMVAMLSVGFASCGSDDDDDDGGGGSFSHPIVGTWECNDTQMTFNANMTFVMVEHDEDETMTATGDYKIDGNRITTHYTKISVDGASMDIDMTDSGTFEINGNTMVTVWDTEGDTKTWTRKN